MVEDVGGIQTVNEMRQEQKERERQESVWGQLDFNDVELYNTERKINVDLEGNHRGFELGYSVKVKGQYVGNLSVHLHTGDKPCEFSEGLSKLVHVRLVKRPRKPKERTDEHRVSV